MLYQTTQLHYSIVQSYENFFTYSSADEHIGFLCLLAIVNSATMKSEIQIYLWNIGFIAFGYICSTGAMGQYCTYIFFFNFGESSILFSTMAVLIYIPINNMQEFFSPIFLQAHFICSCLCELFLTVVG